MNTLLARTWAIAAMLVIAATAATTARAQDDEGQGATLKVGDPAPPLVVDKWVKGEPVKELETGKVYVLEFWATWCGPCIQAIPHVTELQKKYEDKGLVVVGMNIWENDVAAVEPFVKKMGDKMGYRVATDQVEEGQRSGKMAETWMAAAGRNGIPSSFIVDREGKIAWIGHPMQMDGPLAKVIEGKFDAAQEAAEQAKIQDIEKRLQAAISAQDYDKALAAVDEGIAASPETAKMLRPAKLMILIQKKDYKAANAAAKEMTEGESGEDQRMLLTVANLLLEAPDTKDVDLGLAMSAAEKAAGMEGDLAWAGKMMMAKGHAAKGDHAKAVEFQTQAVEAAPEQAKQQLQGELDAYKAKANDAGAGKSDDAGESKGSAQAKDGDK